MNHKINKVKNKYCYFPEVSTSLNFSYKKIIIKLREHVLFFSAMQCLLFIFILTSTE